MQAIEGPVGGQLHARRKALVARVVSPTSGGLPCGQVTRSVTGEAVSSRVLDTRKPTPVAAGWLVLHLVAMTAASRSGCASGRSACLRGSWANGDDENPAGRRGQPWSSCANQPAQVVERAQGKLFLGSPAATAGDRRGPSVPWARHEVWVWMNSLITARAIASGNAPPPLNFAAAAPRLRLRPTGSTAGSSPGRVSMRLGHGSCRNEWGYVALSLGLTSPCEGRSREGFRDAPNEKRGRNPKVPTPLMVPV